MIKELGQNKYRFIVSVGGRTDRRRYCKTVTHKGGKKALQKMYDEFEAECQNTPLTDITVKDLLESYVAHCRTLGRKAETIRGYKTTAKRCYKPIGAILAKSLTTYRLEKFVAEMGDNGLSAKTIKNTIGLLSAAYDHAIFIGQLDTNPCKKVSKPQGQARDVRILYLEEIPKFLEVISEVDLNEKVAYELALFLGLRRSEIIGLRESDVDIVRGMINIHNTRHRVDRVNIEQDTKTVRSTRTLALPDNLLLDIARLMEMHRQFKYTSTDYLVQNGCGEPLNGQALASRLERLEKRKGLPHVTLHGLRHTYASLLHSQGVDMANISAELGHSNLATTMNIYTHILNSPTNASRGIATTINDFMLPQKNGVKMVANESIEKP